MRDEYSRIGAAFHPVGRARFDAFPATGCRFAHYTSAEAAVAIISGAEVWMRQASLMNDFSELEYGAERWRRSRTSLSGSLFDQVLEAIRPGLAQAVEAASSSLIADARGQTWLTAVCEHPPEEDGLGRLSMWRAYGGDVGVCVVLNTAALLRPTLALQVFDSPVEYLDDIGFQLQLLTKAKALAGEAELLTRQETDVLLHCALDAVRGMVLCTKHPGFREEREWRLIHSPQTAPSPRMEPRVRTVGGVPQIVYGVKLRDIPEEGLKDIAPATLVERVIVGPCEHPEAVRQALAATLHEAGAVDAAERVVVSSIPLRR